MTKSLRVPGYLGHILEAIERIDRYTEDMGEDAFLNSELVQDAVIRNIEIIGEAANNIQRASPEFAAQNDDIPWLVMYTMRNRVSHGYDKVDLELVWKTIQSDLPRLHQQVKQILDNLS
ncbi:HepT-like ribonuclease domain-containing protein [Nitrincola sp. MINF-07-Sa-05]|uniref:HepT-like ribonuclease domain-containing protein n=1 Tax=Nitrincola salilacus TaxID=3400273 RepID=UPI003917D5AE